MDESVVLFKELENDIVQITMEDRNNKNAFSESLIKGLIDSFGLIQSKRTYKAVILTGYDTYFCSGGTKEALLDIQKGILKFTDANIINLIFDCEVPVIAAMQGHGIGAGFSFGLFADFPIISRESFYSAVYMKYGFTPGFGSTYILPKKLGFNLAEEILFTGENYRGEELEKRGAPLIVLQRSDVLAYSYQLARKLVEKPRESLVRLKQHLVAPLREEMNRVIELELQMHEKTFNNQEEVLNRINNIFGK